MDVDLAAGMDAGVGQRFGQGFVGLGQVDVLADEGDVHLVLRVLQGVDQALPHRQVGRLGQDAQLVADDLVQHLVMQHGRDLVDGIGVEASITASGMTLQNSAILRRSSAGTGRSARHSRMSGWMPISRSSLTECWVGLVFSSPAVDVGQQGQVDEAGAVACLPRCPSGGWLPGRAAIRCRPPCRRPRRWPHRRLRRRA
jgi:hypothetical protein